jgi:starch synthase
MFMADKKRILVVTQEFSPFTETLSKIEEIAHTYSQYMQDNGMEIRILMPRFGCINERRHRLHEVVRLSGMNITVDDEDYPLIIKVASLPGTRMQIYFLDNDEFFKRKKMFTDNNDKPFEDNMDRMIFFCKGVIETVKKFGWAPDLVHCHGWMTSLLPAYLKNHHKNEPIFQNARFIYSLYPDTEGVEPLQEPMFSSKSLSNQLTEEAISVYKGEEGINLHKGAAYYADGIIADKNDINWSADHIPTLEPKEDLQDGDWSQYLEFFNNLMLQPEQSV